MNLEVVDVMAFMASVSDGMLTDQ